MNSSRMTVLGLAMVVHFAVDGQRAKADDCYGAFVVRNPSNVAIRYQVKWGDGEWKSTTVPAGYSWNHYFSLDENGRAPTPYIRFDARAGDNAVTHKSYKLGFYATHSPSEGKKYKFRYSRCGCYLDLYED